MSAVQSLYEMTKHLLQIVESTFSKEDRETVIEEINALLVERDNLLSELQAPYSDEEKNLGKQLIEMNAVLDAKLKEIKQQIGEDLKQVKKTKTSTKQYVNPYQGMNNDGMFFDKRK
ncbi:flagellar protein FliT [Bacillus timonensis]|nr:flagellar protein FliT [Bacillus timonensis]